MPELPEVESIRCQLEPLITGKTIIKGHSFPSKKFSQAKLASGFHVQTVKRRGKYLLVNLEKKLSGKIELKELIIQCWEFRFKNLFNFNTKYYLL